MAITALILRSILDDWLDQWAAADAALPAWCLLSHRCRLGGRRPPYICSLAPQWPLVDWLVTTVAGLCPCALDSHASSWRLPLTSPLHSSWWTTLGPATYSLSGKILRNFQGNINNPQRTREGDNHPDAASRKGVSRHKIKKLWPIISIRCDRVKGAEVLTQFTSSPAVALGGLTGLGNSSVTWKW